MPRALTPGCASAATAVAVILAASGCSSGEPAAIPTDMAAATASPVAAAPVLDPAALPPAPALADVLYSLADPAVPGADKLSLIADAEPPDAPALDGFATALRDGGFTPLTVTATDVGWSDSNPGDVRATVTIAGPQPGPAGEFQFPMEFAAAGGAWQLTRETADLLLAVTPP